MTKIQENIIEQIEALIDRLCISDREDKAKGELESLKSDLRFVEQALNN